MRAVKTTIRIGAVILLLFIYAYGPVLAFEDKTPPIIDKTEPSDGMLEVPLQQTVQVWILDPPVDNARIVTGVDPDTVHLWVQNVEVTVIVEDIGNNRVHVRTRTPMTFQGHTWVHVDVTAKDHAGNAMAPYSFDFFTTQDPDMDPPVIDHLSPPDKSMGNIQSPVITCWVRDEQSEIDLDSIEFIVNGDSEIFTYAIMSDRIELFHVPSEPFDYNQWVNIEVRVADICGNFANKFWEFQVCQPPPNPPAQHHPANGALLNYQHENGNIRFIWSSQQLNAYYRIRIRPSGCGVYDIVDLGPDSYWVSGLLKGFTYNMGYDAWNQFSDNDFVEWSISMIDSIGGACTTAYSGWSSFILAPPDAVVLRTPSNGSSFTVHGDSPVFSWDNFDGAESYLFGIAKFNTVGGLYENKITLNVESEVTSLELTPNQWYALGSGTFIWAVLAQDETGSYSNFMNYQFTKMAPFVIDDWISFQ